MKPAPPDAVSLRRHGWNCGRWCSCTSCCETDQFTEFDAHYFPGEDLPFTRVSEPKNYAALREPAGVTVLCAEIPCGRGDDIWSKTDDELGALVTEGLARAGLPVRCPVLEVVVRRLPAAYPIYRRGYEEHFAPARPLGRGSGRRVIVRPPGAVRTRQHASRLFMADAAVRLLEERESRPRGLARYRRIFDSHVVED